MTSLEDLVSGDYRVYVPNLTYMLTALYTVPIISARPPTGQLGSLGIHILGLRCLSKRGGFSYASFCGRRRAVKRGGDAAEKES